MAKNEETKKKKSVAQIKADIRKKIRAAFRKEQPKLSIEIPLVDGKPAILDGDGRISVRVEWEDVRYGGRVCVSRRKTVRSREIKLPKKVLDEILTAYAALSGDELHSRISAEYRLNGYGSARNIAFGRKGRSKGEQT